MGQTQINDKKNEEISQLLKSSRANNRKNEKTKLIFACKWKAK